MSKNEPLLFIIGSSHEQANLEERETFSLKEEEVDLLADFKLAGNLKIPLLKQIVNLADPLSKLSKLKIQGNWKDPEWSVHLNAIPLRQ